MRAVSQLPWYARAHGFTELPAGPPLTLTDEHVRLLWQVTARAAEVLNAAAEGRWPGAELASLAGYAGAEVLRQASDEETLLFPAISSPAATQLARDHARLRAAAELLTRAACGEQPLSPDQLAAVTRDFVGQLEYHINGEEMLLAAECTPRRVPATVALGDHPHT